MENKKFSVNEKVERLCAGCDVEQSHTVLTATKQGVITKIVCDACATESVFKSGVKTSTAMTKSKTAALYDRTRKYRKGQAMVHTTFGQGEVMAIIEPQKIDVLFGDRVRRLIHAQEQI